MQHMLDQAVARAVKPQNSNPEKTTQSEKPWLTNAEAMAYLGLSRPTLSRYRATGRLRYSKIGKNIYYRRSDIEAILESSLRSSTTGRSANGID
jgi:excisionase family DNA binding protein